MKSTKCEAWVIAAGLLALAACSTTELKSSWRDPSFDAKKIQKILVIGVGPNQTNVRVMEEAFSQNFTSEGTPAAAAYTLVTSTAASLNEESWRRLAKENHMDAVFVSRLVDVKSVEREVPPSSTAIGYPGGAMRYGGGWYGYYNTSYQVVTQPGYTVVDHVAVVEAKLFEMDSGKLLWTGHSETQLGSNTKTDGLIREYARVVTRAIYR